MPRIGDLSMQFAALAEPTRLRLLLACRDQELSVGQLAEVLNLPEPAISRHLATLARAGLLTRERLGREVRYQWSTFARAASWLSAALTSPARAPGDVPSDVIVRRDQARLARLRTAATAPPFVASSLFGQRLAVSLRQLANSTAGARALAMRVSQGPVLAWLHGEAAALSIVAPPEPLRQSIAAFARERGIAFKWADEQQPVAEFDLVCVMAATAEALQQQLAQAALWLAPQGRVLLALPYDALDQADGVGQAHPLFRLRAMLTAYGFACERLLPLEAIGEHWLLACGPLTANTGVVARQG
jgi:DNA-binding transcriptional ArsR family regulator